MNKMQPLIFTNRSVSKTLVILTDWRHSNIPWPEYYHVIESDRLLKVPNRLTRPRDGFYHTKILHLWIKPASKGAYRIIFVEYPFPPFGRYCGLVLWDFEKTVEFSLLEMLPCPFITWEIDFNHWVPELTWCLLLAGIKMTLLLGQYRKSSAGFYKGNSWN